MTRIDRFQYDDGTHSPLSNFYPSPFELDGFEWPTVEHYFQANKSNDPKVYHGVREQPTSGKAKKMGRAIVMRPDWEVVKLDVMRKALAAKFAPGSPLAEWLLATGDALLVEGNHWHDNTWGVCTCERHGEGENWLGTLLMARRAVLRSGECGV